MEKQRKYTPFLTGEDVKTKLFKGEDVLVRPVSLDLKVGCIVKDGKVFNQDAVSIGPQEMVVIILEGEIMVPWDCFGIAYPKTSLCQKGLHILNTGIIDPGYEGSLSTVAINFKNSPVEIRKNDVFLRLILYQNSQEYPRDKTTTKSFDNYIQDRIEESENYPKTFLDVPGQMNRLADNMSDKITNKMMNKTLFVIAAVTIFFTLVSFWINSSGVNNLQNALFQKSSELSSLQAEQDKGMEERYDLLNKYYELEKKYEVLLNKVDTLENQLKTRDGKESVEQDGTSSISNGG